MLPDAAVPEGRSAFRPEIQALRALAVLGVVLYHLWPRAVPGGYVGVDVFFVISGFLITQQLVTEVDRSGTVSLTRFWARRIRRILPAALTVLLACTAFVALAMPRVAWDRNLTEIRASAAYVENWHLGERSVDYLAAESSPSLVQHYWSLSVEEQFYLAWPLLVLVAVVLARRGGRVRRRLALVLSLASAASFAVSLVWTRLDQPVAFFATPARAWEFGVGGLLALALPALVAAPTLLRFVLSWAGAGLLGYSLFALDGHARFPGWVAVLPVAGAAVFLAGELGEGGLPAAGLVARLRPVQWLGDSSYPIYLWHWPLAIGAPWVLHHPLTWYTRVGVLAAALLLAALTKRYVEDPVRTGRLYRTRRAPAYSLASLGLVSVLVLTSLVSGEERRANHQAEIALRNASSSQVQALLTHPRQRSCFGAAAMEKSNHCARPFARPARLDTALASRDGVRDPCLQRHDPAVPLLCLFGEVNHPVRTVAVVGNSHAWRLVPALQLYAERHHWKLIVAARTDCLGLTTRPVGRHGASANCLAWSASVQHYLLTLPELDAVLFQSFRDTKRLTDGVHATAAQDAATSQQVLEGWRQLRKRGARVLVIQDVPGMRPENDPDCIARSSKRYDPCSVSRSKAVRSNLTSRLAQRHPELVTYVRLDTYFCDSRRCHGLIGGVVVYFDGHHLTTTFSRSLARYLGDQVAAVLRRT